MSRRFVHFSFTNFNVLFLSATVYLFGYLLLVYLCNNILVSSSKRHLNFIKRFILLSLLYRDSTELAWIRDEKGFIRVDRNPLRYKIQYDAKQFEQKCFERGNAVV